MSSKKKTAAAKDAAPPATPCDRGPDTPALVKIGVPAGQRVAFDFFYCFTPGNMIVKLDGQVVHLPMPLPNVLHIPLPKLPVGLHTLTWLFHPVNTQWKAVSEVLVGGTVQRRQSADNTTSPLHLVLDSVFVEAQ